MKGANASTLAARISRSAVTQRKMTSGIIDRLSGLECQRPRTSCAVEPAALPIMIAPLRIFPAFLRMSDLLPLLEQRSTFRHTRTPGDERVDAAALERRQPFHFAI